MRRLSNMLRGSASAQVYFLSLAIVGLSGGVAHAAGGSARLSTSQFDQRWGGWASASGYLGSATPGYGNLGVFAPLSQDASSLWFSQINGKVFDGGLMEGNLAIGHRQMTSSGFNFGFWGGLDMRKTASDNLFGQVSGGVEALSKHFDFRVNGYLPLNGAQMAAPGLAQVLLSGNNIFMVGAKEVPLYGADVEAGVRLPFGNNAGHLGVYGGGYWFNNKDAYQAVTGVKARVELALNDVVGPGSNLTAQYQYSDDKVRGVRQVFGAGLRIPFGGSSARPARATGAQDWRMTDPLERDTDIVIGQSQKEQVADAYTGVRFDRVAYANSGTTLANGIGQGSNTLIILDGAKNPVSGGQTLGSQQTLLGGGGTLKVTGVNSGATGYVTAPGSRPTISNPSGSGYALLLAGYNTVNGVDVTSNLTGAGINDVALGGIDGSGESHLAIVDTNVNVSMTGTGSNGVDGVGGSNGTDGGNGISGNSTLTGINLAGADQVWLTNTTVTAIMTGTGGNGGKGGNNTSGGDGGAGGNGGAGINGSNTLTGIDLANADHVWLGNTTVTATMTGRGGDGGNGGDGSTSTTIGTGGTGGIGGGGIDGSTLTGIQLTSAQDMSLTNTTVTATMTGTGGTGGDGGNNRDTGHGGVGSAGATGIASSTIHGIDLSSFVGSAWLTNTTVTATMNGTGGAGGNGGSSDSGGIAGAGGTGIAGSTVHGIDLSSFVGSAWLTNTVATATMNGTGGAGGGGGDGIGGGDGGAGGTGVDDGTVHGIDASNGNDAWWTNTVVTATINGTGGAGGDGGGGDNSSEDGKAGAGGAGINAGELFGIAFGTPNNYSLTDTTVVATLNGVGGYGGFGKYGRGASGAGISGITPHGLYPDTMPIPGVIFSGSKIINVTP